MHRNSDQERHISGATIMGQLAATWMKTTVVAIILTGALATSGCSSEGFTWINGDRYRFLGIESRCAPDGSPVLWQRANDAGDFGAVQASSANCTGGP